MQTMHASLGVTFFEDNDITGISGISEVGSFSFFLQ